MVIVTMCCKLALIKSGNSLPGAKNSRNANMVFFGYFSVFFYFSVSAATGKYIP